MANVLGSAERHVKTDTLGNIRDLAAVLFGNVAEGRFLVLKLYLDDSGSHGGRGSEGNRYYWLAGYIASVEAWAEFERKWQALLDESPQLPYMKMCEAERKRHAFSGLTPDRLLRFAECIMEHKELEVSSVVPWESYNRFIIGKHREFLHTPYALCFSGVATQILRRFTKGEKIAWILDFQGGNENTGPSSFENKTVQAFHAIRNTLDSDSKDSMFSITYADDKRVLPLQAADMIAWNRRRDHENDSYSAFDVHPVFDKLRPTLIDDSAMEVWFDHKIVRLVESLNRFLNETRPDPEETSD